MRTTLSIDDDVLEKAKATAAKRRLPFRTVINEALRAGLKSDCRAAGGRALSNEAA